jgi:hypothetical protein
MSGNVLRFDTEAAHRHSSHNLSEIERGDLAACFYCLSSFPPTAIGDWVSERPSGKTALCPRCGIDSVIGSAAGFPLTPEFLKQMKDRWFGTQ